MAALYLPFKWDLIYDIKYVQHINTLLQQQRQPPSPTSTLTSYTLTPLANPKREYCADTSCLEIIFATCFLGSSVSQTRYGAEDNWIEIAAEVTV